MCGPWASSLIAKQKDNLQKISGKDVPHWMIGQAIETSISNSVRDKIFEIISKSNNLKRIHLYGGEPLLIDFHDELCEYLISTNRSKTISLTISSNLQVDLHRKLELYNHFNKIHLSISVDGIEDTYEYVRWPGKWEKLKRNIIEWASVAKHHNEVTSSHYNTTITFVLQNINIDNICNFLIEMQKLGVDNHILVERVWGTNLIEIIPTKIIEEEIEKLNKLLKVNESDVKFIDVINNAKNLLESCIEPSKNLDRAKVIRFFEEQYQHDMAQNQNLFTTKPYFLELAKQFNIDPW
jgi:MoaA/NifB/PqqE/SkfB family radical SAM enzyme